MSTATESAIEGDLHLDLSHAHRLDQDRLETRGVKGPDHLRAGRGQAAEVSPGGHRPDEDVAVGGVILHADAVTEQRPAGEGGRGVDGQHPHARALVAVRPDERAGDRRLPGAGRARQADHARVARQRREFLHDRAEPRGPVLDQRDEPREGTRVTVVRPATISVILLADVATRLTLHGWHCFASGTRLVRERG